MTWISGSTCGCASLPAGHSAATRKTDSAGTRQAALNILRTGRPGSSPLFHRRGKVRSALARRTTMSSAARRASGDIYTRGCGFRDTATAGSEFASPATEPTSPTSYPPYRPQFSGRGVAPRRSRGTLQLSTRCSSLALPPSRSLPVRVDSAWTCLASPSLFALPSAETNPTCKLRTSPLRRTCGAFLTATFVSPSTWHIPFPALVSERAVEIPDTLEVARRVAPAQVDQPRRVDVGIVEIGIGDIGAAKVRRRRARCHSAWRPGSSPRAARRTRARRAKDWHSRSSRRRGRRAKHAAHQPHRLVAHVGGEIGVDRGGRVSCWPW